ncbi:hypothetical protein [Aeromonas phage ZPAH34]|uniref:hypothetical protein n=1 Tax=Aeromonas phage ZPAH34 TaxID=2924888 RepID=UPI0023292B22|nr:hypothetical protein PQD16_gp009 [Aeromonas phage ZPAH34]UOX39674.1 hypothetical protein [Aeromonas phage ZPAH34]
MNHFNYYRELAVYLFFFPLYMESEYTRKRLLEVIGNKKGCLVVKIGEVLNTSFILQRNKNHIYSLKVIDLINKSEQVVRLSALGNLFKQEQINKIMNYLGVSIYKEHLENSYFEFIRTKIQNTLKVENRNLLDKLLKRPKKISFDINDSIHKFYIINDYEALWKVWGGVRVKGVSQTGMLPLVLFSVFEQIHAKRKESVTMDVTFGNDYKSLSTYLAKNITRFVFQ